jgi:hypothetical protein
MHIADLKLRAPSKAQHPSFFDPPSPSSGLFTSLTFICERAREFIHTLLPLWAENHCYRTYAYGLAIADLAGWSTTNLGNPYGADALGWDKELWFLTAILHDIGWDAQENLQTRLSFEIFGGIKARELLMSWGAPQQIADEVCESIIRHTVSGVCTCEGPLPLIFIMTTKDSQAPTGGVRLMAALIQVRCLIHT